MTIVCFDGGGTGGLLSLDTGTVLEFLQRPRVACIAYRQVDELLLSMRGVVLFWLGLAVVGRALAFTARPLPPPTTTTTRVHRRRASSAPFTASPPPSGPPSTSTSLAVVPAGLGWCCCCGGVPQLTTVTSQLAAWLTSGPYGVLALASVASGVLIPLTQIRNLYAISVGYGASVGVMGMVLRRLFHPASDTLAHTLSGCTVFYGFRLAFYLLLREKAGWKPAPRNATTDPPSRWKRIPFSISLGLFYALMTAPVLYVLRSPPALNTWQWNVAWGGTIVAWLGAILEAVADTHKFLVKNNDHNDNGDDDDGSSSGTRFVGPTQGTYRLVRHPNYLGEIMHWTGTYLAGVACFGPSVVGWAASSAGLYGILSIMQAASKGLEDKQATKYGGQASYEAWKKEVPAPLIPFVKSHEA